MVQQITHIIKEYQARLREMPYIPKTPYRRDSLGYCDDANELFLAFLFSAHAIRIRFIRTSDEFAVKCSVTPAIVDDLDRRSFSSS